MSDVPPEILVGIFSRLPVKSLLRFRTLSKTVRSLIDSPYFVNLHLKQNMKTDKLLVCSGGMHSPTSFRSLCLNSYPNAVKLTAPFDGTRFPHVFGSCHGLLGLSNMPYDRSSLLWNPSTKKYTIIPPPIDYPSVYSVPFAFDQIGYDHVNGDYKIVKLIQSSIGVWLDSKVFIYSLSLNVWQSVEQRFPYHFLLAMCHGQGVCVNGALHWLVNKKTHPDDDHLLVSFDLASQSFKLVPHPKCFNTDVITSLGELGGCLYVVGHREKRSVDVWVMEEYGVKESWSKLVSLTSRNVMMTVFPSVRPMTYLNNRKEVVLELNQQRLVRYDLEKKSEEIMYGVAFSMYTHVYQETLFG